VPLQRRHADEHAWEAHLNTLCRISLVRQARVNMQPCRRTRERTAVRILRASRARSKPTFPSGSQPGPPSTAARRNRRHAAVNRLHRRDDALLLLGGSLERRDHAVRRGGAAAIDIAWVACGRLDGYWESGLNAWDWAAGSLLVTEAGGFWSCQPGPLGVEQAVSACPGVYDALFDLLQ
jgi:fructose-1,6-bisphosphatase/inositol monophosphatase family enzyme